jgi:superoxide dismutase, Fe-Mn family
MAVTLMPLPYDKDALAPHISRSTLDLHHGAHHKGYVDKVNEAVSDGPLADAPLEAIVLSADGNGDAALFNSAAQAWNHGFYWHSLTPESPKPSSELAAAIERDFGSMEELKRKLREAAEKHFASGWAWLVANGDQLRVITTHDAGTPITGKANPLLAIDVWEHAYYLDVQSSRPDYISAVIDNLLNWDFASVNFARGRAWTYPA